jgi:hypothetical protein
METDVPSELYLAITYYLEKRGWKLYDWKGLRLMCIAPAGLEYMIDEGQETSLERALRIDIPANREAWDKAEVAYLLSNNLPEIEL